MSYHISPTSNFRPLLHQDVLARITHYGAIIMPPLGKTDEVVDMLRHLPYIKNNGDDDYHFLPYD